MGLRHCMWAQQRCIQLHRKPTVPSYYRDEPSTVYRLTDSRRQNECNQVDRLDAPRAGRCPIPQEGNVQKSSGSRRRGTPRYTIMTDKQAREKVGHALRDLVITARKEQQGKKQAPEQASNDATKQQC